MKENSYDNNMSELDEEKVNYQELLFRYIIHWPWFVGTVLLCLVELELGCIYIFRPRCIKSLLLS